MLEIKNHTEEIWWIIRKNDNSVIHYGVTPVGMVTQSGLDLLETFTNEEERDKKLLDYGITATTTNDNI
jgi:hypothetical protein